MLAGRVGRGLKGKNLLHWEYIFFPLRLSSILDGLFLNRKLEKLCPLLKIVAKHGEVLIHLMRTNTIGKISSLPRK